MGICHQCYQQTSSEALDSIKTLNLKSGQNFGGINFIFTNRPLHQLKGDCLVFYLDHVSELSGNQVMSKIHRKSRRKILEYLTLAEQQVENSSIKHTLVPLSISSIKYKYLLFVKMQPWDGQSREQIQKKIYNLTVSYLEVFKLRKFKSFTIAEFDPCLGIHHSISCLSIAKSIQKYSKNFKNVTILCNSHESINFYYRNFNSFGNVETNQNDDNQRTEIQNNRNSIKKKKSKPKDQMLF